MTTSAERLRAMASAEAGALTRSYRLPKFALTVQKVHFALSVSARSVDLRVDLSYKQIEDCRNVHALLEPPKPTTAPTGLKKKEA